MSYVIGTLFWLFIAWKVGSWIGKGIGGEMNVWSYKQYNKEEQRIAKRYNPDGRVYRYKVGDKKYEQYLVEVNELRERYGKSTLN